MRDEHADAVQGADGTRFELDRGEEYPAGPPAQDAGSARVSSVVTERLLALDHELLEKEAAIAQLEAEVSRLRRTGEQWCDVMRSEGLGEGESIPDRFQLELKQPKGDRESERFKQQAKQWAKIFDQLADSPPSAEGVPEWVAPFLALSPNFGWGSPVKARKPRATGTEVVGWVTEILKANGGGPMRLVDITEALREGESKGWRVPGGGRPANVAVHLRRATATIEKIDGKGWKLKGEEGGARV